MSVNNPAHIVQTTPNSAPVVEAKDAPAAEENPFKSFTTKSFNEGKEDTAPGAEDADATPAEDTPGEDDATGTDREATDEEGESTGQEETAQEPKPAPKVKRSAQDRINNAVRKQRAAEARATAAEARAEALEKEHPAPKKDLTPPAKDVKGKDAYPSPDDFEFGELDKKYITAVAKFEAKAALAEERAAQDQTRQEKAAQELAEQHETEAMSLLETGFEKFGEEFDTLVIQGAANNVWALSDTLGQLMGTSAVGADIAMHLARDPKEALRVYRLPPMEQAAYFGRMEARFSSQGDVKPKKQVQAPKAPAPVQPARGSGGKFSIAPDTNDFAAFEKMATKQ